MNQEQQNEISAQPKNTFITKWKKMALLGFVGTFFLAASYILATSQLWLFIAEKGVMHTENILRIGGSTTVYPFSRNASRSYTTLYPNEIIIVSQSSTGDGIKDLLDGRIDLAGATRLPNAQENEAINVLGTTFDIHTVGRDAVAVIVHPSKYETVQKLSIDQLRKIFFTGEINDWSMLDPTLSGPIHPYIRDSKNSGTAATFAAKVTGSELSQYVSGAMNVHITTLTVPTLAEDPDGIAFTPLEWVDESVRVVAIVNDTGAILLPTTQAIESGEYPLSRDFYYITRHDRENRLLQKYLEFAGSPAGDRLMEELGFVPLDEFTNK